VLPRRKCPIDQKPVARNPCVQNWVRQRSKSSSHTKSTGDEAGSANGIVSGTVADKTEFISYSFNVKIEGEGVVRNLDMSTMNNSNTFGLIQGASVSPSVVEDIDADSTEPEDEASEKQLLPIRVIKKSPCGKETPIVGAEVKVDSEYVGKTSSRGVVVFKGLPEGSCNVEVVAENFDTQRVRLKTVKSELPHHDIVMAKDVDWDLAMIPDIIRANKWGVGAKLMDYWFSREGYTYPDPEDLDHSDIPFNDAIVTLKWVLGFERAKDVHDKMWNDKVYVNEAGKGLIEKVLLENKKFKKNKKTYFGDLSKSVAEVNEGDFYIQNRVFDESVFQGLDGLVAALANFGFRMAVQGEVTYKESRGTYFGFGGDVDVYEVRVKQVGIYVRDSYDFMGSQFGGLGYWNPKTNKAQKTNLLSDDDFHKVKNIDFREWRSENGCGGDFIVFSDMDVKDVSEAWEVEL